MIPAAFADHARLMQEPWGFTPHAVAALTRWQVRELYLRPASGEVGERPTAEPGVRHDWSKGLPPKDAFVGQMMRMGGDPAAWAADWDRMTASHQET